MDNLIKILTKEKDDEEEEEVGSEEDVESSNEEEELKTGVIMLELFVLFLKKYVLKNDVMMFLFLALEYGHVLTFYVLGSIMAMVLQLKIQLWYFWFYKCQWFMLFCNSLVIHFHTFTKLWQNGE